MRSCCPRIKLSPSSMVVACFMILQASIGQSLSGSRNSACLSVTLTPRSLVRRVISSRLKNRTSNCLVSLLCYLFEPISHVLSCSAGEIVLDGTDFRNSAHLRYKADLFVPCGGRPEAVNISNMNALIDGDGKPHFKYIVEGANLFFTQQARLLLEKRKVILFKDSSTNKGKLVTIFLL